MQSGGAICFASGFQEAGNDELQTSLIKAAGDMPFLGPNCYGLLNYLDNVTLWPDQHGGKTVKTGVGILAQSSNIAINISMQKRGLDIGQIITIGNQAQTDIADLIESQIEDPRITVIGLYLEGFGDISRFERAALKAAAVGKPIVALKVGISEKSQISVMSHTASLAGNAAISSAFLKRLGITETKSTAVFLETLKILHILGPIANNGISSVSCSGGEASLMADIGESLDLDFPDFSKQSLETLGLVLGPDVSLANPLDYHTYIWGDVPKMTKCFEAVMRSDMGLNIFVLDIPRIDRCDPSIFECAIEAIIAARSITGSTTAVLVHLSENIDEATINRFHAQGIVVLNGMKTGLAAVKAACMSGKLIEKNIPDKVWISKVHASNKVATLSEYESKVSLASYGLNVPKHLNSKTKAEIIKADIALSYPLVLKTLGLAHKTEANGVILNIKTKQDLITASNNIADAGQGFLIEEMCAKPIVELIIGVSRDPTGLLALTLGAGGVYTELLKDSVTLTLPTTESDIVEGLSRLRIYPLLTGYRGQEEANIKKIIQAIMVILAYVRDHQNQLLELDINPLLAGKHDAVAVDAFIRLSERPSS